MFLQVLALLVIGSRKSWLILGVIRILKTYNNIILKFSVKISTWAVSTHQLVVDIYHILSILMDLCKFQQEERKTERCAEYRRHTGRNFGLKIGGTNSEEERGALGFLGEREGEWGGSVTLLIRLCHLGERREFSQRGLEQSPGRKRFTPQIASDDSKFFTFTSWKVGILYPSVQKVGVPVPLVSLYPRLLRLWTHTHRQTHTCSERR